MTDPTQSWTCDGCGRLTPWCGCPFDRNTMTEMVCRACFRAWWRGRDEEHTDCPICKQPASAVVREPLYAPGDQLPPPKFEAPTLTVFDSPGGVDGQLSDLLTNTIRHASDNAPRSLQKALGPSEIGTPCRRRIGYQLADVTPVNTGTDPLASIVGTGGHIWLASAFAEAGPDWLVETRVTIAPGIEGSGDLFHVPTGTVIDWKFPGPTKMTELRRGGHVDEGYRIQVHAYGVGYLRLGHAVKRVAIAFLPRAGRLDGMHLWSEPFDPAIAADAMSRLTAVQRLVDAAGTAALPLLPTADAYCTWCPFWQPGSTDPQISCAGHAPQVSNTTTSSPTAA